MEDSYLHQRSYFQLSCPLLDNMNAQKKVLQFSLIMLRKWLKLCELEGHLFGKTNYTVQTMVDVISRTIDGP